MWPIALRACWLGAAAVGFSVLCVMMNPPQQTAAASVQSRRSLANLTSHAAFMEYIGGVPLSDVPVIDSPAFDFHFLLAFATDPSYTEGHFNATWQPILSPANIAAIKALHPNIKFSCSVGGGGSSPSVIFQPSSLTTWVKNAVSSLSAIISTYHLDGIDIDFETFVNSTEEDFASAIGQLITQLKQKNLISFATIAPYPDTDSYYGKLWSSYNNTIDYVNYQMYSSGDMPVSEYVSLYSYAKSTYSGGTVLASFETVSNGTVIIPASGLDGCKQLKEMGELEGIFIWSADQSYSNFQYEKEAQTLLESTASPSPSPAPTPTPTSGPLQSSPPGPPANGPLHSGPLASPASAHFSHGISSTFVSHNQVHTLILSILVTLGIFV